MKSSKIIWLVLAAFVIAAVSVLLGFEFAREDVEQRYVFDPGDSFITNITDSKSLLKSDLLIEINDRNLLREFEKNTYKIRDLIISVLRSKSYEDMKNPNVQSVIKTEIKEKLKEKFNSDAVADVFFNEFVLQ